MFNMSLSCVWLFVHQASLSFTISQSLLILMPIEFVMPSNHLILCHPLFLLLSICPSIRVSSNESVLCIRWSKYWSFSFSISPSSEHPGLISFRMDWLDLFAVQGILKSLLQHHSSKASILQHSAFFVVHLSHPYLTTGKNIALTRWTFVGKVMSLLFNMLSRFVISFSSKEQASFNYMASVTICRDFGAHITESRYRIFGVKIQNLESGYRVFPSQQGSLILPFYTNSQLLLKPISKPGYP